MQNKALRTRVSFLLVGVVISAITAGSLLMLTSLWSGMEPATCVPNCFCEAVRTDDSIRQPVNTWSSLAFVLSGTWILSLFKSRPTRQAGVRLPSSYAIILTSTSILIGIGSAFLHASLTLLGQFLDVSGMYLLATFMLLYACERLFLWRRVVTITAYILLTIGLDVLLIEVPESRRYVFAIVIVLALILEAFVRRVRMVRVVMKWWYAGLILLSSAYVIWILDNRKLLCQPYSLIQGHAIWHISGAIAVVLLYKYYASEPRSSS